MMVESRREEKRGEKQEQKHSHMYLHLHNKQQRRTRDMSKQIVSKEFPQFTPTKPAVEEN